MYISDNVFIILTVVVAFLLSFSATPVTIALAKKINAVAVPGGRNIHKHVTPRIGGLAIFYGFIVAVLCFGTIDAEIMGILIGAVIVVTVGFIDDISNLRAIYKLFGQIVAAVFTVLVSVKFGDGGSGGVLIERFLIPFSNGHYIHFGVWSIPITVIWIVGVTNAVNLIDGLDGLAVGVSSIASMSLLAMLVIVSGDLNIGILIAALIGAGFGFLPYNFNPAKTFMGDTGSNFLGFMLACVSVMGVMKTYALISFAVPILVLGLPIFDTSFAILRRFFTGKPIMAPDRGHLHHRLLDMGFSQRQTVAILYTMTALLCMTAVVMSVNSDRTLLNGAFRGFMLVASVLVLLVALAALMASKNKGESDVANLLNAENITEEGEDNEKD